MSDEDRAVPGAPVRPGAAGRPPLAYLRPDLAFEPLVCGWPAWPLLLSPSSLALIARQRPLAGLQARLQPQLALAQAVLDADALLQREASGQPLEPLYARLPAALRGLVELGHDLNQRASLRFFEPLLYAGACYDAGLQSVRLRRVGADASGGGGPDVAGDDGLLLELPFDAPLLDDLARLRWQGADRAALDRLHQRLRRHGVDAVRFNALLTGQPPPRRHAPPRPGTLRVRHFGHASLLIESDGVVLMTDPGVAGGGAAVATGHGFADLPDTIDYVLLTHNHPDHVRLDTLLPLRHRTGTIVVPAGSGGFLQDPSLRLALQAAGFGSVVELQELQSLPIPGGAVTGLPFLGAHGDLHIRTKLGYQVEVNGHALMCLAESNDTDPALCERLQPLVCAPDILFIGLAGAAGAGPWPPGGPVLPQGPQGPHSTKRQIAPTGRDAGRAPSLVDLFSPRGVFLHGAGTAPVPPGAAADALLRRCHARGIAAEWLAGRREIVLDAGDLILT